MLLTLVSRETILLDLSIVSVYIENMAKDGNSNSRWIASGLFAVIIVVLAPLLHEVIQGAKANAAQDATISAISATNDRIERKVDRILERLSIRDGPG